jgi:hypothetical protein
MSYWVIRPFFEFLTIMGIEDCVESDKTDMGYAFEVFWNAFKLWNKSSSLKLSHSD